MASASNWVATSNSIRRALPRCGDRDLILASPKNLTVRKLMRGSWFETKRLVAKHTGDLVFDKAVVALDPGESVFQTSYGTDGVVSMWGQEGAQYLHAALNILLNFMSTSTVILPHP